MGQHALVAHGHLIKTAVFRVDAAVPARTHSASCVVPCQPFELQTVQAAFICFAYCCFVAIRTPGHQRP